MDTSAAPRSASLIKPQLQSFSGSGRNLAGVVVERDLEDATAYIGATPRAGAMHVLVVPSRASGRLAWTSSGRRREAVYTPRDLILNPTGCMNAPQWKSPMELLLLGIDPAHLARVADDAGARSTFALPERYHFEDRLLEELIRTLARQFEQRHPPDPLYTESLTQTLMLHLLRRYSEKPLHVSPRRSFVREPRIRRAVEFIQANLAQRLSLAQIAAAAELGTSQFSSIFKSVMNTTPHQYVLAQRMARALALLKETSLPIAEVALRTGFADQSHLTRVLQQHHGMTPKHIRR